MNLSKIKILALGLLIFQENLFAFASTNFYKPYDINLRMDDWKDAKFKFGTNFEYGNTSKGRDGSENRVNVLQLYNPTESALTMLMGAEKGSEIYQLANSLIPAYFPATDDGVRGRLKVTGKFEEADLTFWGKYKLPIEAIPGNFDIYVYVPFKYAEVKNVNWVDQTKNVLSSDRQVHALLTDNLNQVVKQLGGLDLGSWKKFGLSDIATFLAWYMDFKQTKEHLRNVRVNVRIGLSAPTASQKNEDKVFSMSLGNDGSWVVPISTGIDLDFVSRVRGGLDFEITLLSDVTRIRRMKTDMNQTDFLLLHKGDATKSYGFSWKFNLFVQAQRFLGGLSAMLAYQFSKHDDDKLTAQSNVFSYYVINSAESLNEWSMQNFIVQLNYDFFSEFKNSWFKPQFSLFYKMPITGKRVINPHTFGAQLALNF